jgi:hypothetical protein
MNKLLLAARTAAGAIALATLVAIGSAAAQEDTAAPSAQAPAAPGLQRFVIERDIPGAGKMSLKELREAAARSNEVLRKLGPDIQWVQSYVTGDKLYCVYNASSADIIREHAAKAGFPANKVTPVSTVIDPTTAN